MPTRFIKLMKHLRSLWNQKKFDETAQILIEARKRLPKYYDGLTEKLAFIYYQQNQKQKALGVGKRTKTSKNRTFSRIEKRDF